MRSKVALINATESAPTFDGSIAESERVRPLRAVCVF